MSANNGDKARFHRLRKAKLARRKERIDRREAKANPPPPTAVKGE